MTDLEKTDDQAEARLDAAVRDLIGDHTPEPRTSRGRRAVNTTLGVLAFLAVVAVIAWFGVWATDRDSTRNRHRIEVCRENGGTAKLDGAGYLETCTYPPVQR